MIRHGPALQFQMIGEYEHFSYKVLDGVRERGIIIMNKNTSFFPFLQLDKRTQCIIHSSPSCKSNLSIAIAAISNT